MTNNIVYSTKTGRVKQEKEPLPSPKGDGIVRIQRQTSGRKGKGVIVIAGLPLNADELFKLAAELKKKCGCGGSVKDDNIEIQGDKREIVQQLLEQMGYKVKLAGG